MSKYITDLEVSLNEIQENQLRAQGFSKIDVDLNGIEGKHTYIWYKRGNSGAITRIQFSFTDPMSEGLSQAGYQKIPKPLNVGMESSEIFLWFFKFRSQDHVPIVDLVVSTKDDPYKFKSGWERYACDLSREGHWVFLWVKREKPTNMLHIDATANSEGDKQEYNNSHIRLTINANRGAGGAYISIWYHPSTKSDNVVRDLQVSISADEANEFNAKGYHQVEMDLNKGTGGKPVFLWFKNHDIGGDPIKAITQVVTKAAAQKYEAAGVEVIWKDLNEGVRGAPELYLCFHR